VFGEAHPLGRCENRVEGTRAIHQAHLAQVIAVQVDQVEDEEQHGVRAREARYNGRVGIGDARLDQLEAADAFFVEHHDLAVQDGRIGGEVVRQHVQLRILAFAAVAVA